MNDDRFRALQKKQKAMRVLIVADARNGCECWKKWRREIGNVCFAGMFLFWRQTSFSMVHFDAARALAHVILLLSLLASVLIHILLLFLNEVSPCKQGEEVRMKLYCNLSFQGTSPLANSAQHCSNERKKNNAVHVLHLSFLFFLIFSGWSAARR